MLFPFLHSPFHKRSSPLDPLFFTLFRIPSMLPRGLHDPTPNRNLCPFNSHSASFPTLPLPDPIAFRTVRTLGVRFPEYYPPSIIPPGQAASNLCVWYFQKKRECTPLLRALVFQRPVLCGLPSFLPAKRFSSSLSFASRRSGNL